MGGTVSKVENHSTLGVRRATWLKIRILRQVRGLRTNDLIEQIIERELSQMSDKETKLFKLVGDLQTKMDIITKEGSK